MPRTKHVLHSLVRDDIAAIQSRLNNAYHQGDNLSIRFWSAALQDVEQLTTGLAQSEISELDKAHRDYIRG